MSTFNQGSYIFYPKIITIGYFIFTGVRIDYSRVKFTCHEIIEIFESKSIFAIEVRLKEGKFLDHLYLTLLSGNKKCTTSSIYSLYSGYSYLFEGPLLRDCQDFILPSNKYSYYIPMKYESAIESVSLYGSRFKMMSPLHTCHFWYTDHLVYCSVSCCQIFHCLNLLTFIYLYEFLKSRFHQNINYTGSK